MKNKKLLCFLACLLSLTTACKKLVEIDLPKNTITTPETFKDSTNAISAILGIYSNMENSSNQTILDGALSSNCGESSDELVPYYSANDPYYTNSLLPTDGVIYSTFWYPTYQYIYQANGIIEGVQASNGISPNAKNQIIAEAKFLRALDYFYLVNLFGNVPMVTSTDYHTNELAGTTSKAQIYQQIIKDLLEAQKILPTDYASWNNDRVRATKWAVTALLARTYLYTNTNWSDAENQATLIINNTSLFGLNNDLNMVFSPNSFGNNEAILQWQVNPQNLNNYNATPEGMTFVPVSGGAPNYYLSDQLLNVFERGDKRRIAWVDSTNNSGTTYYFPYKYKLGQDQITPNGTPTEYITIFRLAELYLIRAESRAEQNKLSEAINDLNVIRNRAGLPSLPPNLTQAQILKAVARENRIEFFAEEGHRWLDLKRTLQVDQVMTIATPAKGQGTVWQSYQQLYPIPLGELQNDPNIKQNPGY